MRTCKRSFAGLMTMLAGAAPLAINATCDPRTGAFYFDRYDDDEFGFFDDGYYSEEFIVYDEFWF